MKISRILKFFFVGGLILVTLLSLGGLAGYYMADALRRETSLASVIAVRLESMYNSAFYSGTSVQTTIKTNRLNLKQKTVFLPLEMAHYAGGISGFEGNSVLVLDREGRMYHVREESVDKLDVAPPDNNVTSLKKQSEAGAFAPANVDFKGFRYNDILHVSAGGRYWLLVSYTEWHPEKFCFNSAIARLEIPAGKQPEDWHAETGDWEVIVRTVPCLKPLSKRLAIRGIEAGGRMAQYGGSKVIWTSGAYERDDFEKAPDFSMALGQDVRSDYGKVLEVDLLTGDMRHLARGLRNPQGLAIDAERRIWVTDHGMRGGDELNLVFEGANFGYPAVTYGTRYNKTPAADRSHHTNHDGYDQPMMAFVPSIAPGSAIAIDNFNYAWDGDILVGAFRGSLYRVHSEEGRPVYAERIDIGVRPRDMVMLKNRRFAVLTDFRQLAYFSVDGTQTPIENILDRIADIEPSDLQQEVSDTFDACMRCHSLSENGQNAGPSLYKICGRVPGSQAAFKSYSNALSQIDGLWNRDRIAAFIVDPEAAAPGTSMQSGPIGNVAVAEEISKLLCPVEEPS